MYLARKLGYGLIVAALCLAACGGPAPAPTPTAQAQAATPVPPTSAPATAAATATTAPTETAQPTATDTPEPTATATNTPAPQPITAANAAQLVRVGLTTLPKQPSLPLPDSGGGLAGAFTADSQYLLLQTDAGVDVLAPQTLEVLATHSGLTLVNVAPDGRFVALRGTAVVLVAPLTGEEEASPTPFEAGSIFAVNNLGTQAAALVDAKTVRLYDLTSATTTDLPLKLTAGGPVVKVAFAADGAHLAVWDHSRTDGQETWIVFDLATGQELYRADARFSVPAFSADGQYFIAGRGVGLTATGEIVSNFGGTVMNHRGLDGAAVHGALVEDRVDLSGYFAAGGPASVITFWTHQITTIDDPTKNFDNGLYHTDYTYESYVDDLTTNTRQFAFSGYGLDQLAAGFGAPDGSVFVLVNNDRQLALHSLVDGARLLTSDYYTLSSPPALSADASQVGWSDLNGVNVYDPATAAFVLQAPQPYHMASTNYAALLPDGRLLVENRVPEGGDLAVWDLAAGSQTATLSGLAGCRADAAGLYLLCNTDTNQRIRALDNPDKIVFSTNDLDTYTVLSPMGDSYVTCAPGSASLTYALYAGGKTTLKFPCQPLAYSPDATQLYLQDGTVVDLASGDAAALTLAPNAAGQVFSGDATAVFVTADFIVINNVLFDRATGARLVELAAGPVWGLRLSADGLTLTLLTNLGLEQWQVVD